MHSNLLLIKQAFLETDDVILLKELLQLFLWFIVYKWEWWTLEENYSLYNKTFEIFIIFDENPIGVGGYEIVPYYIYECNEDIQSKCKPNSIISLYMNTIDYRFIV